jgi:hypothetical protein
MPYVNDSSRADSPGYYDHPLVSRCRHTAHTFLVLGLLQLLACKLPELLCIPSVYVSSCNHVHSLSCKILVTLSCQFWGPYLEQLDLHESFTTMHTFRWQQNFCAISTTCIGALMLSIVAADLLVSIEPNSLRWSKFTRLKTTTNSNNVAKNTEGYLHAYSSFLATSTDGCLDDSISSLAITSSPSES